MMHDDLVKILEAAKLDPTLSTDLAKIEQTVNSILPTIQQALVYDICKAVFEDKFGDVTSKLISEIANTTNHFLDHHQ